MKVFLQRSFFCFSLLTVSLCKIASAQTTYYSRANNANWNSGTTWSTTGHGGASAGAFPVAGDIAIIGNNNTIHVNTNSACASLQLGSVTTNNLGAIDFTAANLTLTVSGNIQVGGAGNNNRTGTITFSNTATITAGSITLGNSGGTPGRNNTIDMTSGGTLNVAGSIVVNTVTGNTWTPGAGLVQLTATNTLPATIFTSFNNLTINGGTTTLGVGIAVTGALNITSGTLDANAKTNTVTGLATVSGGTYLASTATQTFNGGLTISGGTYTGNTGGLTVTDLLLTSGTLTAPSGTFSVTSSFTNNGGTFTPGANTVTFSGAGAKTISGSSAITFQNVTMSTTGSAVVNVNRSVTLNGTLSWTANGLLVVSATSDLTLGSSAVITSPNSSRYIQLDGTSSATNQLIRINNNSTAAWQFLFPIGTATGGYTPLDLSVATVAVAPTLNSTLAVKAILGSDATGRMKRTFRMIVAGNSNATTFSGAQFTYSTGNDISSGDVQANYNTFWYQKESTGIWSALTGTAPGVTFFTGPTVAQSLANDTYYFTIGSSIAYGGNVWYSYQSGNWNDPTVWTTDGSLFPLYVNPTNAIPGAADNVVITSGRTVSMNVNGVATTSLSVTGTLDLLASTGHTFTTISGSGRIKMSAATDNFPSGTFTNFSDPSVGGTIEINGAGMSLNQARTFNNMVINMTGSTDIATLLSNITLNGDLTVTNGLLRFNDNATGVNRTFTVNDDVIVAATGGIRTGSANARHEFNLYGDFTNNGTAYFTNRVAANTGAEATDGIVDVNFLSATQDQQVVCNGVTRFYRIEITKGADDTYKATISAADPTYFNLFGAANYDINEANAAANSNGSNLNALGLNFGTVELGANVTVILNTVSNYAIYEGARLWVNGATVSKSGGTAIVPYGTVRVSAGSLTVDLDSGLTLRNSGVVQVDGGTVTVRAIRTSTAGAGAVGSYIQSGGTVILTGGTVSTSYATFSLTYTGNVFNMSGGTLTIQNRVDLGVGSLRGAIFINSDPANISVTGGTVIMETDNNISYKVTSRAAFWNVIMRKTAGTNTTIELAGTTSGTGSAGVDELTLVAQPLVVLNDFKVEGTTAVTFLTNNNNLTVSGNLEIQTGATYTPGTNTTTITGSGVSSISLGTASTQVFNNLTINKTTAASEVVMIAGNATALRTTGTLTVTQGIYDYASFIVSARGPVSLGSGITIGKSASTGKLLLDGTADQTITSSGASIYNIELNNTDPTPVITLSGGDLTILKTLTMTAGIFNIGTNQLTLSGASASIAGASFSSTKMIQTAGNGSDGGLAMYVDANEIITYPIGVSGKYTPAVAQFASFSDDGLVRIVPVNSVLQTTDIVGGGADILAYYWKASHSNFTVLPKVSYKFTYINGDAGGTQANYRPGKVIDVSPFTRSLDGATDDVDDPVNKLIVFNGTTTAATFPGVGFTLEVASYTAGGTARFSGSVNTYYSVSGGDWNTAANWSKNAVTGGTAEVPQPGSVVVINSTGGAGHRMNITTVGSPANVAAVQFNHDYVLSPVPTSETVPRVQFWVTNSNALGLVTGTGMVSFNGPNAPTVTGDFGDFGANPDSYFLYWGSGGSHTLTTIPTPIPNLMLESATFTINQNITVNANLISQGNAITIPAQNIRVLGDLLIGVWQGGTFQFPGTAPAITVTVDGDLDFTQDPFAAPGNRNLTVNNPGVLTLEHSLIIKGNIIQGSSNNNVIDLYNGATNRPLAALEFQGTGTHTYSRSSTSVPDLYRITCNKGSDQTSSFSLNNPVTLNAPTNVAVKAITLTNGLLIINNTGTYTLSSGGGNFDIPSTAGLQVNAGTVNMTTASTGLTLSGLLRVSGGTVTLDAGAGLDNYIEYSNTGTSTIEVTSGTLTVGSQIRRSTVATTGVLNYTQSNGTVVVGNRSAPTSTRGVFEILNTGSSFNHSGGSLTLVRGNGSSTIPSLWLEPASSNITSGSTITIGNANTPAGNIGIQSTVSLNNLAISGLAASAPVVKQYVSPLTVNGSITVAASNTLDSQGLDLNVGGDFTINGTFTSGNNITSFTNTSAAAISGTTPTLSFYNFTKTGAGTLSLSKDITVNRDLKLSAGTLASVSFSVNLKRHAQIDATHTSTSGSGLIFNGTAQQQLTRSAPGTATVGILTINNSNGVIIPDGNGYDFAISDNLRLQSGVFDVGGSLLSLGSSALITPVNSFSVTNMIQTNSSFTDKGVKKQFPTGYTTNFTFPVGQLNYTPVTFDFSTPGNTTGSSGSPTITVRPANERHPSIINDNGVGELPDPVTFNDLNNVLQYYWIINADNVASSFKSTMTLQYVQPLVSVVTPYTEADYLAARVLSDANPTILINKFNTADVNETSNTITFSFTGVTDAGISGDYFAGVDLAIPDNVAIYTTTASGNVDAAIYTPVVPGGGAPTGALVIVQPGHNLTLNLNSVSLYETQINAGGKITIPSGSIGHRLGTLSGTGDLEIDSNTGSAVLPAAVYDDFFSCVGGGLIFGGSGGYEILGGITTLRNLTLLGTGSRTLANNDVIVCNDLTLTITGAGSLSNTNSRLITIGNDFLLNSGSYYNSGGALTITRDLVQTLGLFDGGTGGAKSIGRNLNINGGTFTSGSGAGTISINGNMTLAGGATFTGGSSSSAGVRYIFQGSSAQTMTGNFSGTRFINRLDINNSAGLTLAGNVTIDRELLLTSGNITPGSNTLLLSSNATSNPTEGRSSSLVSGKLYKVISTAGSSFTFPIGKGSLWRPGSVNSVSNAGDTWDMEYFYAPATSESLVNNLTPVAPILRIASGEYWKVSDGAAPAGRTAYVGLSWGVESDVSANLAEREAMQVVVWNDALTRWDNYGGTTFSPGGTHTQSHGSFISSSPLSFSENIVSLGSTEVANPLPVSFVEFVGTTLNGINSLKWSTASELNNDYFEIERSGDGEHFEVIGRVAGKGTFNSHSSYSLDDKDPIIGTNYYRLRQIDFDGKTAFHDKVLRLTVDIKSDLLDFEMYPNPVNKGSINLTIFKGNNESVRVRLLDMTGKEWLTTDNANKHLEIQIPAIGSGVYIVEVSQGARRKAYRLIIKD